MQQRRMIHRDFNYHKPQPSSSGLVDLIRGGDWSLVASHVISHPCDANYRTSNQSTPLHHACLYGAPYEIVKLILSAHLDALVAEDSNGWTPLEVALTYAAPEDVCLMLIRRAGVVVSTAQSRCHVSTKHVSTLRALMCPSPLNVACRHGASTAIIKALLETNSQMASVPDLMGEKPAKLLWLGFRKQTSDHAIEDLDYPEVEDLLVRMVLLIHATQGRPPLVEEQQHEVSLQEIIELDSELDHLISVIIRLYPDKCRRLDENGNLPLHVAASRAPPSSSFIDTLDLLLQAYPSAAKIPDSLGRLPLHLALSSKRTWKTGIQSLVQHNPESLTARNVVTQLYPAHEADDVDTTYELLQAWPSILQIHSK
jgi:ankyrin repeat protein